MGQSNAMPVEVTASYARRAGDNIEMVLHLPEPPALTEASRLRWRSGKRVVTSEFSVHELGGGVLLRTKVPASSVDGAAWRAMLDPGDETENIRLQARLVANPRQPVALLTGRIPSMRLPAPAPRQVSVPAASGARRAAVALVDRALAPLPDERAARYREALVGVVRRFSRS